MTIFTVNRAVSVVCNSESTRYGFRHIAVLHVNGSEVARNKACYYNRTWESYQYETVLRGLYDKADALSDSQRKAFRRKLDNGWRKDAEKETTRQFGAIAAIAKLGEIMTDSKAAENDWKKRMLSAGLGNAGLSFPDDWGTLSEEEKQRRLDGAIGMIS